MLVQHALIRSLDLLFFIVVDMKHPKVAFHARKF